MSGDQVSRGGRREREGRALEVEKDGEHSGGSKQDPRAHWELETGSRLYLHRFLQCGKNERKEQWEMGGKTSGFLK